MLDGSNKALTMVVNEFLTSSVNLIQKEGSSPVVEKDEASTDLLCKLKSLAPNFFNSSKW